MRLPDRIAKASNEILGLFKNRDPRYRISKKKVRLRKVQAICERHEVSVDYIIKILNL